MLDSEKVFAIWTLGSPNTLKTYDKINQRCVPQPDGDDRPPGVGRPGQPPVDHRCAMAASYATEAILWAAFIEQHLDELPAGKIKVASLVHNNDFGNVYDLGFKAAIADSPDAEGPRRVRRRRRSRRRRRPSPTR